MTNYKLMDVIIAPVISEKSTKVADNENTFVFKVKSQSNKVQIKRAIEMVFGVEVDTVRVLNNKGKLKRFGKYIGKRKDSKKAYVKLKPGHEIDLSLR